MSTSLIPSKEVFLDNKISDTPLPTPTQADKEKNDESEYMNEEEKEENSPTLRPRPTTKGEPSKKSNVVEKKTPAKPKKTTFTEAEIEVQRKIFETLRNNG